MTEEPTQQIRLRPETTGSRPQQVTPPLPAGLDPRGRRRDDEPADGTEPTGVLHLDELFATETDTERHIDRPSIEDAPTWTAMPVVPVRSEPYSPPTPAAPTPGAPAPSATTRRRLSTDLAAAKRRTGIVMMRTDTWLRRDDNALMVLTALIACVLILLVAAVGH